MENNVRQLRKAAQITQSALAEATHTSQQQIQRIESGAQTVRLDVARAIANVLKTPLAKVFPGEAPPSGDALRDLPEFEAAAAAVSETRSNQRFKDTDVVHRILVWLRGGHCLEFPVSELDSKRLEALMLDQTSHNQYFVVDSYDHHIAINRSHVTRAQTIVDRFDSSTDVEGQSTSDNATINLDNEHFVAFMSTEARPVLVEIDPDLGDLESDLPSQLSQLYYDLHGGDSDSGFFSVVDQYGETALFSLADVAAVSVHRKWVGGNFDDWADEEADDEVEGVASANQ